MKRLFTAAFLTITLAMLAGFGGCATTPQNAQQGVYGAKQSYAVALTVAVAYKRLPVCAVGGPVLCSKPDVVKQLQLVDTASSALLDAAEATVRTEGAGANAQTAITAATQAVAAFTTITSALAVK